MLGYFTKRLMASGLILIGNFIVLRAKSAN